ncbi:hypothetical protein [Thermogemmatispora sp.]|uniref:hypothetical protein n=1 Tax=Thermogemmatispora sp. TaxID=1968838 RepID=UPI001D3556C6|nr:hypothetical protein [Thermogemmatispora sp.]MBX5451703.1 hypothetical protein [Thermogemmatispora sp.]
MALIGSAAVVGIFEERSQAEQAIGELKAAGFKDEQITRLSREPLKPQEAGLTERLLERARARYNLPLLGGIIGAVGGGLFSLLASLVLPLTGVQISGGPMLALCEGLVLGALGGGFLGTIIGPSLSATGPRYTEAEAVRGRTIIMVRTLERQAEAALILRKYGARNALVPRATETAAMAAVRLAGPEGGSVSSSNEGKARLSTGAAAMQEEESVENSEPNREVSQSD